MYAYDEMYLDDAMCSLGEMLDYAVYDLNYSLEEFWAIFIYSWVGQAFQMGHPKYNAGMSGVELAREVIHEVTDKYINIPPTRQIDCTREYWTGWILAYYQHQRNISFKKLKEYGISAETVINMYILHEADPRQFLDRADEIVAAAKKREGSQLKRMRTYAELTQKQLAEKSGVSLRMIQLYEQGQNDISKAQAAVVLRLATALNCTPSELL